LLESADCSIPELRYRSRWLCKNPLLAHLLASHCGRGRAKQAATDEVLTPFSSGSKFGFVNRVNRVPYYQRLFQRHDGLRQWQKVG
jgi:hypothetical protein